MFQRKLFVGHFIDGEIGTGGRPLSKQTNDGIAIIKLFAFLKANLALAARIGIDGTPGWVIGDCIIDGAVGSAALGEAIAEARRS